MPAEDPVVVGIDGGDLDQALLRWAAEDAKAKKARLMVCHLWEESDADGAPQPVGEEPVTESTAPERRCARR